MQYEPLTWAQLSRVVGFKRVKEYEYPTLNQIEILQKRAYSGGYDGDTAAHFILAWYRFLPAPKEDQIEVSHALTKAFLEIRSERINRHAQG